MGFWARVSRDRGYRVQGLGGHLWGPQDGGADIWSLGFRILGCVERGDLGFWRARVLAFPQLCADW